jgi:hypothetical protein
LMHSAAGPVDGNCSDAGAMTAGDFRANVRHLPHRPLVSE